VVRSGGRDAQAGTERFHVCGGAKSAQAADR